MWPRYLHAGSFRSISRKAEALHSFNRHRRLLSSYRILCIDVPPSIATSSCIPELVHRGHVVDQYYKNAKVSQDYPNSSKSGSTDHDKLEDLIPSYDALIISRETKLSESTLINASQNKLRVVALPCDQYDSAKVNIMEATIQDIMLLQLEKKQMGDPLSVEAEIAFSLLLDMTRPTKNSADNRRGGENIEQLSGKCMGIIGLGQAGMCVAEIAKAFAMRTFGYDPNLTQESAAEIGVTRCGTLEELYGHCDVLSFHAPLTGKTRGMFNENALRQCKEGVKVISVSEYCDKEGLFDRKTLLQGLTTGKIGGLAIDILHEAEGGTAKHDKDFEKIMAHSNSWIQFHEKNAKSFITNHFTEARRYRTIAENLSNALARRELKGVTNGVFMPLTLLPAMRPFLELAEAMGKFLYQYLPEEEDVEDSISRISISTTGGVLIDITTAKAKSALQNAVMKGFLLAKTGKYPESSHSPRISLLNASLLAMTAGIDVRLVNFHDSFDIKHLKNSITLRGECRNSGITTITGSVFGEEPRIVRIDEYIDIPTFRLDQSLLLFKNEDQPGVVAQILQELAGSKINIANFGLARQEKVQLALGVLALDSAPSEATMTTLRQLPSVHSLRFAQF